MGTQGALDVLPFSGKAAMGSSTKIESFAD